jgi:hypothetical protein
VRSLLVLLAACGGGSSGIAPPPPYTPTNTPQADTECPAERDAAQEAREDLLEHGDAYREKAAEAVFLHAECERGRFDARAIQPDREEAMIEALRATRIQYQSAVTLYEEVTKYQALRWTVGASTRLGALNAAFADKLRKVGAPTDMTDTVARINFVSDLGQFAEDYDRQAGIAHQAAVETAALLPSLATGDSAVSGWVRASCEALSYLDPTAKAELAACN